jgi:hypothetical protein
VIFTDPESGPVVEPPRRAPPTASATQEAQVNRTTPGRGEQKPKLSWQKQINV